MESLAEGRRYGLSSFSSTSAEKSVVHVKLTDSALRAFEDFKKNKEYGTSRKPSLKFQGTQGVIKVPVNKSSDNPEGCRNFMITLSAIQGDPKGSFEALYQDGSSRHGHLEGLGAMSHKLSVHATNDAFIATKEKMTLAEEESKKQCAKEIKLGGRKIKKVIKRTVVDSSKLPPSNSHVRSATAPGALSAPTPSYRHNPGSAAAAQPRPAGAAAQPRPAVVASAKPASINSGSPAYANSAKTGASRPSTNSDLATTPAPLAAPDGQRQHNHNRHSSSQSHKGALAPNPAVINMPYRDRVVHLLALRPYKKPELIARLQRDGIRDKDRNSLSSVLKEVTVFNPRDNNFTLAKHVYPEVRFDWQFYTEADKRLLKKKVAQLADPSLATMPSPAVSPCHSTSSQGSPTGSQKRAGEEPESAMPAKKQRIAHGGRVPPGVGGTAPEGAKLSSSALSASKGNASNPKDRKDVQPESPTASQENNNYLQQDSDGADVPDYASKYQSIRTTDQRNRYKQEFNQEYLEYRKVHDEIEKVTQIFQALRTRLMEQEHGSEDYENIKKRIFNEYNQVKQDPKYHEHRTRHDYLHRKLGHIKRLISVYDHSRITKVHS